MINFTCFYYQTLWYLIGTLLRNVRKSKYATVIFKKYSDWRTRANGEDPGQTAPRGAVWPGSALSLIDTSFDTQLFFISNSTGRLDQIFSAILVHVVISVNCIRNSPLNQEVSFFGLQFTTKANIRAENQLDLHLETDKFNWFGALFQTFYSE